MSTAHIESKQEDIAKVVLMPGDPLRAKYIADNFLTDVKVVNNVRNMIAYTGYYEGSRVTVFPSGMGMPSMGIYAYELFHFYDVEKIIRIGTCGGKREDLKLLDTVLATSSYTLSTFPKLFDGDDIVEVPSSEEINKKIIEIARENNISLATGRIVTSDIFDVYVDIDKYMSNYKGIDFIAVEMEAFALFYLAKKLNKEATCLLTIVDIAGKKETVSSEDRERSLNDMIKLALEAIK